MLGTILLSLWLTLLAVPATAHDTLTDSAPAEGEVLEAVPSELRLTFSGEISELGVQFMVTGPEGRDVVQGTPTVEGVVVTQDLAEELVNGDYEVAWRVTSSDGHPISGTYVFTIEAAAPEETGSEETDSQETSDDESADATEDPSVTTDPAATTAPDPTTEAPTTAEAPVATPDGAAQTTATDPAAVSDDFSEGIPPWGWFVAAVAAVGLVACGFLAFRRH